MDGEELRIEARAVIAAARELPQEYEGVLIDSFLDALECHASKRSVEKGMRPRPRPQTYAHVRALPRWIPPFFLTVLLPFLAVGNPYVATDIRFWCTWMLTALFAASVVLSRFLGLTLHIRGLVQWNRPHDHSV